MDEYSLDKPMDFGETLGMTFRLFGRNFLYIMKVAAVFYLPVLVLTIVMTTRYSPIMENMAALSMASTPDWESLRTLMRVYGFITLIGVVSSLFYIASIGAVIKAVDSILTGKELRPMEAIIASLNRLFQMFLAMFICVLMVAFGMVFCIIPGLILLVYISFVLQVILIEEEGPFFAIGKSFNLMKKNFWQVFLLGLVLMLIFQFVYGVLAAPVMYKYFEEFFKLMGNPGSVNAPETLGLFYEHQTPNLIIMSIVGSISTLIFQPLLATAMTIKYRNIVTVRAAAGEPKE